MSPCRSVFCDRSSDRSRARASSPARRARRRGRLQEQPFERGGSGLPRLHPRRGCRNGPPDGSVGRPTATSWTGSPRRLERPGIEMRLRPSSKARAPTIPRSRPGPRARPGHRASTACARWSPSISSSPWRSVAYASSRRRAPCSRGPGEHRRGRARRICGARRFRRALRGGRLSDVKTASKPFMYARIGRGFPDGRDRRLSKRAKRRVFVLAEW